MLCSQNGPLSGLPFTMLPLLLLQRFNSHLFRVLLLRCLHLPLPLSSRACRCGCLLDCLGHHRASCLRAGVLGRRGFALESAVAQVCREAGARVSVNVFLCDLDLPIGAMDQRRIEVIAEGLPVFHGAHLVIDATLVTSSCQWGATPSLSRSGWCCLAFTHRRKERICPELSKGRGRARLVIITAETGGRFSEETQTLLRLLAEAKTLQPLRVRARQSWLLRWSSLLSCAWIGEGSLHGVIVPLFGVPCDDCVDCSYPFNIAKKKKLDRKINFTNKKTFVGWWMFPSRPTIMRDTFNLPECK